MSFLNPRDFFAEVNAGTFAGQIDGVNANGYQTSNTNGTEADIWSGVVGNQTWLQAASTMNVVSSSVNDNGVTPNTGARTILITGLAANLAPVSEFVTLNGTTTVTTTTSFLRVIRSVVSTSGTYSGNNIGTITITATTGGSTQGVMPIGSGRIAKTHYTVPAGKKLIFKTVTLNAASTAGTAPVFKMYIQNAIQSGATLSAKQLGPQWVTLNTFETVYFQTLLPAGTDIWMTATPGANNTPIFASWQGIILPA